MGASKYTGGRVCAELTAPDSSKTAHTPAAAKRNHRSGLSKVGSAKEARFAFRLVIVVIFTPIGFSRSGLLRICSLRLHLEALDHRLGGRISQNFHFGTQVARSIHLIASFAAIQSKSISHPVEFSTYSTGCSSWTFKSLGACMNANAAVLDDEIVYLGPDGKHQGTRKFSSNSLY